MTPEQALDEVEQGTLRPVYLVMGEESFLADQVASRIREAAAAGGIAGFNEDRFVAGDVGAEPVLSAAKSLPMMAKYRLVMVRSLERWEPKKDDDGAPKKGVVDPPLDRLAEYAKDPNPSTVLLLVASKLHGQRRLVTAAKKGGFLVECAPLHRDAVPAWIQGRARRLGHSIASGVARHVADLVGTDLGAVADAVERLSLYVGTGAEIGEDAVSAVVARLRHASVWELTDAIATRKVDQAVRVLADLELDRNEGPMTLGAISSSVRRLARYDAAIREGESPDAVAKRLGLFPQQARSARAALATLRPGTMERWLRLLAAADLALKGGSKRSARAVIEATVLDMCRA